MGPKQSSPSVGVRVRSYSGFDLSNSDGRAAILRYYAGGLTGQIGERVQYSSQTPGSFIQSAVIPTGGRRDEPDGQRALLIGSLPAHLTPHLLGDDVLSRDSGECLICLDDMVQGDTIARLPCLCVYHKGCVDEWFEVNRSCPEHPTD